MKVIKLEQGTPEWLSWRKNGIGASDAPVLLNKAKFKDLETLYLEKVGELEEFKGNAYAERGNLLEPEARARAEHVLGRSFVPVCAEHNEYSFIRASFDGLNVASNEIMEIKCPGSKNHEIARSGRVPDEYIPQVQWQLFVSGAVLCRYVSYDGTEIRMIKVYPDSNIQELLLNKAKVFWNDHVIKKVNPDPWYDSDDDVLALAVKSYEDAKSKIKAIEEEMESHRGVIESFLSVNKKIRLGKYYELKKVVRQGSVDYSKIKQLQGVDLEPYRKPATESLYIKQIE